jgi:hypothetical protein
MTWPLRARQEAHRALSARLSPSGRSGSRRLNSRDGRAGTVAGATRQRAPTVPARRKKHLRAGTAGSSRRRSAADAITSSPTLGQARPRQ